MTSAFTGRAGAVEAPSLARREPRARLTRGRRRAQLLDCAVAAFARDGLGRTGHAQVAEIAGVSVPSVFRYFPSRQALVGAVLGQVERKFVSLAEDCHKPGRDGREAMQEHARGFIRIARDEPEFARIWLEWSGSLREDLWHRFVKLEKKLTAIVANSIDGRNATSEGVTAVDAALALNGVAHVLTHMVIAPSQYPGDPEVFAAHVVDALLRMVPSSGNGAGSAKGS